MRCIVCDQNAWENVDEFRLKKEGMSLCTKCGFISYPKKWKSKAEIMEYYRKGYRRPPTVDSLYSGQRKLHYHHEFLYPSVIEKWKAAGKEDPVVFDVGAAYGLSLAWLKTIRENGKHLFPQIDLNGSELTLSYRRNAYHEFGLELKEDFDDSKKYDMIMSYKVAEHMLDADTEILRYKEALKEDGFLYISVPTWFNRLHNFGMGGFSIEYYYSPDHVNVWTREHFEFILKKTGFKIVKENQSYYDSTYLCQVGEFGREVKPLPGPGPIKECLGRIKKADEFCQKKQFDEALECWPNFPIARRALYEYKRKEWHAQGIEEIIKQLIQPWIQLDPDSYEAYALGGDLLMRYEKYQEALGFLKEALHRRPKCDSVLGAIANCYRSMAAKATNEAEKVHFMREARAIMKHIKDHCIGAFAQATTWVYNDSAEIPMPNEKV